MTALPIGGTGPQKAPDQLLIVDDVRSVQLALRRLVERAGFGSTRVANDGAQALDELAAGDVACVLCDLRMQGMNGLQVLQKIRAGDTAADRSLPFVLITGHADEMIVKAAAALDATGILVKPFTIKALEQNLNRAKANAIQLKEPDAYRRMPVPVEQAGATGYGEAPVWTAAASG